MAASVGPDRSQYIGEQFLIDRLRCSRHCRVEVPLLAGTDQSGGAARPLDGILVGQKAHVGALTLAYLDDPASEVSRIVQHEAFNVRKPDKGTGPKIFYLGAEDSTIQAEPV